MTYNYKAEFNKWLFNKEKPILQFMRENHMDEAKIKEMFLYDKQLFNDNRRVHNHEFELFDGTLSNMTYSFKPEFTDFAQLVDYCVEDEAVAAYLLSLKEEDQMIVWMRYLGFTYEEIGISLHFSLGTAQYRHKKIQKMANSLKKS